MKKLHPKIGFFRDKILDIIFLGIILSSAFITWHGLTGLTIRGDGYNYFLDRVHANFFDQPYFLAGFEIAAILSGMLVANLFGINLAYYYWFNLFLLLLLAAEFYLVVRVVTNNRLIAFVASFLVANNYWGNYDMYSSHCYCFVLERIIPVVFLLPGLAYLHLYLSKGRRLYLVFTLLFYIVAVGSGHFLTLFTGLFLFYPIGWHLFAPRPRRSLKSGIVLGVTFLVLSGFFIYIQRFIYPVMGPKWSFSQFILQPQVYLYPLKMAQQLVYWSQYFSLFSDFNKRFVAVVQDAKVAQAFIPYILVLYGALTAIVYQGLPKYRALLFTTIFGVTSVFFLNAYFNQYDVMTQPGSSRYLYFPTYFLSLFWALVFWWLFSKKTFVAIMIGAILLLGYWAINARLIRESLETEVGFSKPTRIVLEHFIKMRPRLLPGTLVVGSYDEVGAYESAFFTQELGGGDVRLMSEMVVFTDWPPVASVSAHVVSLYYDPQCRCAREEVLK